jgi:hypothetical protein
MWAELTKGLASYESAVLTGRDAAGYPCGVRCHPRPDAATQTLRLDLPAGLPLVPGPTGLLCHYHDEQLWNMRMFNARGTLERDNEGWFFRPTQFLPGMGSGGALDTIKTIVNARKTATRYLAKRGLARPAIPWAQLKAAKAEAERED